VKRLVLIVLFAQISSMAPPALAQATFHDRAQAQRHCPADVVVRVNPDSSGQFGGDRC